MSRLVKQHDFVIYKDEQYNSFPNVVKKPNGELMVVFRQAPDRSRNGSGYTHIDSKSKAAYVLSRDNGRTWEEKSRVLYDDYCYGIQDPCVNRLKDGTLLCTFFTWQVLLKTDVSALQTETYDRMIKDKWVGRLGVAYTIRSEDGGETWDDPIPVTDPSRDVTARNIRGNLAELDDGSLLLPMYIRTESDSVAIVVVSTDKGRTWTYLSQLAKVEDHMFHEPNLFRTASGKLVALLRTTDTRAGTPNENKHPLYTSESYDNGRTWTNVQEHAIYSPSPFHALQLQSGQVLLTYGHRYPAYGVHAYLLDGECTNIDEAEPVVLRDDGLGRDIGYTNAVQLDNGDILIAYYYIDGDGKRYIAGTMCREED